MARPKKEKTFDRRVSVRVSAETHAAYERIAAAFGVPVGQLLRQVLTLEVAELETLVAALRQGQDRAPFVAYSSPIGVTEETLIARMREGGATGGGLTARLRQEAQRQQGTGCHGLVP